MQQMRCLSTLVFFVLFLGKVQAQQTHFIYIQSDNKQPFSVVVNQKEYKSSSAGYTIVPKLLMGKYSFEMKFPDNQWPNQSIELSVSGDAGYVLKNFGEKGWGLFNLQTMAVTMNAPKNPEEPKHAPVPQPKETSIDQPVEKVEPPTPAPIPEKIVQLNQLADSEGYSAIYILINGATTDTIRVFIPGVQLLRKEEKSSAMEQQPTVTAEQKPILSPSANDTSSKAMATKESSNKGNNCTTEAGEKDFLKLRKKMAEENNTEGMLKQAAKGLKDKCYSTEQVKNLSVLFLSDEGRFQFLKLAYPSVSDKQNFASLSSIFVDKSFAEKLADIMQ